MPEVKQFPVVTTDGSRGTIFRRSRFLDRDERNIVRMDDGREFEVPAADVQVLPDGMFLLSLDRLPTEAPQSRGEDSQHPPHESRIGENAEQVSHESDAAQPVGVHHGPIHGDDNRLFAEDAAVERVRVNRLIDAVPQTRQEGDLTIIPIIEEVLVVEKRLLLKEEIHIRRTRNVVREPKRIMVKGSEIRLIDGTENDVRN